MKKVVYANIEAARLKKGLTKEELSKRVKITSRTYYNYIYGNRAIPSSILLRLSKTLNCSVDYLLG